MRLLVSGLALAFAVPALAGAAVAQAVSTQPLAANEVLLELTSMGTVSTRADLATIELNASARGATEAEARSNVEALLRRVTAIVRAAGVAAGDIEPAAVTSTTERADSLMVAALIPEIDPPPEPGTGTPALPPATAHGTIGIVVRDADRAEALLAELRQTDGVVMASPAYALADPAAARREARNRAIATARADAESYAAALGMRVVRIVRVTERVGMDFFSLMMNENAAMRQSMATGEHRDPDIETSMMLGVDFALAPQ